VQCRTADRSQAWLAGDVTRQDAIVPLTVHDVARAMGWGPPCAAHAIICLLLVIEP
jgi:hypothetical protein